MKLLNIAVVAGVRPQFIKTAAIQQGLANFQKKHEDSINAVFINTAQHYDDVLSETLIKELNIKFNYQLTHDSTSPSQVLVNMFLGLENIFNKIKPIDWVLVMGDTTTSFVAATTAARMGFRVLHIEAGVRSGDLSVIEEVHRRVISHISSAHFCTSKSAIENLAKENITKNVFWVGDITHDFFMNLVAQKPVGLKEIGAVNGYILAELHKPVNLNDRQKMINLLESLSAYSRDVFFVLHPRTKKIISEIGYHKFPNISFIESLPYGKMISLMKGAQFLLTDSGGLQRECYYMNKRCLIRRDTLGWSNFINTGAHKLISADMESIIDGFRWAEENSLKPMPKVSDTEFIRPNSMDIALANLVNMKVQ